MALAKKGTRRITVEGDRYRWTVAPNDEPGIAIVIEHLVSPAQRAVVWVDHGHIISSGLVRSIILSLLKRGWQARLKGPEMQFRILEIVEQPEIKEGVVSADPFHMEMRQLGVPLVV